MYFLEQCYNLFDMPYTHVGVGEIERFREKGIEQDVSWRDNKQFYFR